MFDRNDPRDDDRDDRAIEAAIWIAVVLRHSHVTVCVWNRRTPLDC